MAEKVTTDLQRSLGSSYLTAPVYLGAALDQTGQLNFFNSSSALATTFQAGNTTTATTYTFPLAPPTASGFALTSLTTGVMSWASFKKGTAINDNAAAGDIGEYMESIVASATNVPGSNGQWADATSLPLTAGDWDVSINFVALGNGATFTRFQIGISSTSGNSTTGLVQGSNQVDTDLPVSGVRGGSGTIASYRVSLASSTTTYFKVYSDYTVATPQFVGRISARRPR